MATVVTRSNPVVRERVKFKALTADYTIPEAESGITYLLDAIGEVITLPAVATGLNYRFVCTVTTVTTDWTIINGADVMSGSAEVAGAIVACATKDVVTLVVAKWLPGDWVYLESDGTNWYVSGETVTAAGCTFTT